MRFVNVEQSPPQLSGILILNLFYLKKVYEISPVSIPQTCYGIALEWKNEIFLKSGDTVPSNYMVTLRRIKRPLPDTPIEFVPQYVNGKPSGGGLHVSISTYQRLYQALFCSSLSEELVNSNLTLKMQLLIFLFYLLLVFLFYMPEHAHFVTNRFYHFLLIKLFYHIFAHSDFVHSVHSVHSIHSQNTGRTLCPRI